MWFCLLERHDQLDLYISRDAGMTWRESLKGQYYYAVGDHGGLIIAVPQNGPTKELK